MAPSDERRARALPLLAALVPLLLGALGACQAPARAPQEEGVIPPGRTLARDGLAPGGDLLVAVDDAAAVARCRAPQAWHRAGGTWREAAQGPPLPGDPCPRVTARLTPDGRTLAVYDYSAGRAQVLDIAADRIDPTGTVSIAADPGFADEVDAEALELRKRVDELAHRAGEAVVPPDQQDVELPAAGGLEHGAVLGAVVLGAARMVDVLVRDREAAPIGVLAQLPRHRQLVG
jgi:hypothetical protein